MRKLLISLALAGVAVAATPAMAQYQQDYRYGNNGYGYDNGGYGQTRERIQRLSMQIDRGIQRGTISQREGYELRRQVAYLYQLDRRYSRDGLSGRERADLQQRTNAVAQRIRYARNDRDGQWGQWGQNNDGRYNGNYDNDRRYDRRDRDDDD